jgi:hypothetical protein
MKKVLIGFGVVLVIGGIGSVVAPKSDKAGTDAKEPSASTSTGVVENSSASKGEEKAAPKAGSAPSPGLTAENFARIRTGMSVAEVSAIMGDPGKLVSETEAGGTTMTLYQWTGGVLSGRAVIGTFNNGRLDSKTQTGL